MDFLSIIVAALGGASGIAGIFSALIVALLSTLGIK